MDKNLVYLFAGYSVVIVALMIYVGSLGTRQKGLEDELRLLKETLPTQK